MGQSFELQAATEKNPDKNSELVHRVKSSRKNSRVTRSQINDFHAHTNTNEKEKEEEEEEEEVREKELNLKNISRTREKKSNRYHVCKHCKRAFSSGRALGGHIRIHRASFTGGGGGGGHVDFSYNSSTNSLLKPPEVDGSEDSDSDSSASSHGFSNGCSPKMVSLYTLRNNPKRSSILMDPEFALDLIGASGSVSASASASTAKRSRNSYWAESNSGIVGPCSGSEIRRVLFSNWSVTKSRSSRGGGGGGGGVKRDGFLFPKEDAVADDRDTAQLLVMLAGRTRRNNNVDNNEGRESTEESVFDSKPLMISNLESQGSIEDLGGSEESRIVEKKRKRRKKNTHKNERAEEAGNSSVKVLESDMDMDVDVGGTAIIIEEQHQCNTCKKVFNSHQALGGHRASHRKVKGCFAAEGENQEGGGGEEEEEEEEGEGSLMVEAAVQIEEEGAVAMSHLTQEQESFSHKMGKQPQLQPHRCTICHRVFGSGQALGGHKRCHWIGDRITETTTSAISTEQHQHESGGGGGSVRDRSTREEVLDLNQPPPIDEDYFGGASRFDACAESVNQRVKTAGGSFANSTVDSFKAD